MICIPIMAKDNAEATAKIQKALPFADVLELRLDVMGTFDLPGLLESATKPVIATFRSKKEGGSGRARYETRVRYLAHAIDAGADFVDVEFSMPLEYRKELLQMKRSSRIIISKHILTRTPPKKELEDLFRKMAATGADIIKIITYAKAAEDNLTVLSLIPMARKLNIPIITFAMGPQGRISRIGTLFFGGFLTFTALEKGQESASGQIPVEDMKVILDKLSAE